ncbi:MAG: serine hydrolase domain-containing protein [Candidatus Binatia bacterium]
MITEQAGALGFDKERLARLGTAIERDIADEHYDGAALCVARGGEIAALASFGYADRAAKTKLRDENVFLSMSVAKQFTVAIALNRIDRGELSLTTKVADVIPEFGCRGKENITLYQLLTHTAGLMFGPPPIDFSLLGDLEAVVAATCASAVESVPGERVHYSAIVAHAIIAEMVRRVEGRERSFRQILAEDLFEPLAMKDTAMGKREDLAERMCPVVARDRRSGLFEPDTVEMLGGLLEADSEIPAAGCLFTALDLNRFANMLRGGGELDGVRILSPAIIDLATRNYTGNRTNGMWAYTVGMRGWEPFPAVLGLGFFLRGEGVFPTPFGSMASPRTFGGLGAGSNMFWVDPLRDLTCVFLSTGLLEESHNTDRLQRVSDLVHASVVG